MTAGRRHAAFALGCLLGVLWSSNAWAGDPDVFDPTSTKNLPDIPAPPSIADLTHRGTILGVEGTFASTQPKATEVGGELPPRSFVGSLRVSGERNISNRRWYIGASEEIAYGNPPGPVGGQLVAGYPEVWIRGIWASRVGLAYGGGLGLVAPLFLRKPNSEAAIVAEQVRVVRPWDFVHFDDNKYTFRPFLDARIVDGRVLFQLRQGFDVQGLVAAARLPDPSFVSRTTLFFAYRPIDELALGLELWEIYFVSAPKLPDGSAFPDDLRAVFSISPSVRWSGKMIQPSVSAIFPFDRPLFATVQSYFGARAAIDFVFE
ncbi:MAG: hypothetical protein U0165_01380 [Polyangiaceae bacterium]